MKKNKQRLTAKGKTGYRGVTILEGRYIAQIKINGVKRHLGSYATAIEAAEVYNSVCLRTFGEKAILNNLKKSE